MDRSAWWFLLFPGLAMSLGWGLRGQFGHPLGAAIAGALVVLAICLLLDRDDLSYGLIAAFGAVGVGFGGQETYAQTVAFVSHAPWNPPLGYVGLAVKGAMWGLLGGAAIGIAFHRERFRWRDIAIAAVLMIAGTWLGWKLLNEPKRIYFSLDRPEAWAGFILGGLLLGGYAGFSGGTRLPWRFAAWGALGAGAGFPFGAWLMTLGMQSPWNNRWCDWWKLMECTLGLVFGFGLGFCAYLYRQRLEGGAARGGFSTTVNLLLGVLVTAAAIGVYYTRGIHPRFPFTFLGAALLVVAFASEQVAWHVGITMVYSATTVNVAVYWLREQKIFDPAMVWVLVAATSLPIAWWVARYGRNDRRTLRTAFLILVWTTTLLSHLKMLLNSRVVNASEEAVRAAGGRWSYNLETWGSTFVIEVIFTLMAITLTWMACAQTKSRKLP
jgi:hypothetical protein